MKQVRPIRPSVLERRRIKQGVKAAEAARKREGKDAKSWRDLAKMQVPVNPGDLGPNKSYGTPDFVKRGYYLDRPFNCKRCGTVQVWTEIQQKWWYERAKGDLWAIAVLCRPCRKTAQARRAAAREVHLNGVAARRKDVV